MARAIRISSFGGPEVLELVEVPVGAPAEGDVRLQLKAIGVNPVDSKIRQGLRSTGPLESPIGLGSDASGIVVELGDGVDGFAIGDEVIAWGLKGAYASEVIASAAKLARKPPELSFEQGAAMGVPVGTAYQVLTSIGLAEGETLLVHAGAGGVGQAAIQLGRIWGATVVATASQVNHARLIELGAVPVSYGDGLLDRVRAAAPQGIDRVLDAVGSQEAIDVSLALVADPARIGEIVNVGWAEKYGVRAYSGSRPGFLGPEEVALRNEAIPTVAELAAQGRFELEIAASYPLAEASEAHRQSDTGHVRGKVVLIP
jgi:enoyl reductase